MPRIQWEYATDLVSERLDKSVRSLDQREQDMLDARGKDGWELVSVVETKIPGSELGQIWYYFKRPLE